MRGRECEGNRKLRKLLKWETPPPIIIDKWGLTIHRGALCSGTQSRATQTHSGRRMFDYKICLKTVFSETKSKSWTESADTLVTLVVEDDDGWFLFFLFFSYSFFSWKLKMMITEQGGRGNVKKKKARENWNVLKMFSENWRVWNWEQKTHSKDSSRAHREWMDFILVRKKERKGCYKGANK